jgi:hypothetical protein
MRHDRPIFLALALFVASCMNPVHDEAVLALGDEVAGVREGPTHRPGQPCLTCHGGLGPGPEFETAGTVYDTLGSTAPAANVKVTLTDATGKTVELTTNTVGNFYVDANRFTATYPLRVKIAGGGVSQPMLTRVGRRSGCADCHRAGGSQNLVPAVYLRSP